MNTDSEILEALERLGADFQWDDVSIWITRKPGGEIGFTAYIPGDFSTNDTARRDSAFGHGGTLAEACRDLLKSAGPRDPETLRRKTIQELQDKIERLQRVDFGLPPYKPGLLLAPGALKSDVDISARVEQQEHTCDGDPAF